MHYEDQDFVARQYGDATKVSARISLHERFSTNPRPWQRWVFDNLDLRSEARILEIGCGPGNLCGSWHSAAASASPKTWGSSSPERRPVGILLATPLRLLGFAADAARPSVPIQEKT